jgi:saccharopine dehydrogenase-like NADP-dependent oxidoreductase
VAGKNVLLLGLGMQGTAALYDLVQFDEIDRIQVVDQRQDLREVLAPYPPDRVVSLDLDVTDEAAVKRALAKVDLIVEALPAPFARTVGCLAATVGVSLVSSMCYLDAREVNLARVRAMQDEVQRIDELARRQGVTILTEFGLDPGIDLVLGAKACREFDELHEFHSYGAGIPDPRVAQNPLRYKFSWSSLGVMRAYQRPASIITGGRVLRIGRGEVFAREHVHELVLPELDTTLECYPNGDAVRYADQFSLRGTVKEMGRYTCRLPGHCDFWRVAARSGFLAEDPVHVGDVTVAPIQFTAALLASQSQFRFNEGEQDIALVRNELCGLKDGCRKRIVYQLLDRRDLETGLTAMQRTVGFTMALGARLILTGRLSRRGLLTPLDVAYHYVAEGLARHGMRITREELPWG